MDAKHISYQAKEPVPEFYHQRVRESMTSEQVSPLARVYTQTSDGTRKQRFTLFHSRHNVSHRTATSYPILHHGYNGSYRQDTDSKNFGIVDDGRRQLVSDHTATSNSQTYHGHYHSRQNLDSQNASSTKFAANGKVKLSSDKRKREADEDDVCFKRRRHDRSSSNGKHKKDERRRSTSSKRSHNDSVRRRSGKTFKVRVNGRRVLVNRHVDNFEVPRHLPVTTPRNDSVTHDILERLAEATRRRLESSSHRLGELINNQRYEEVSYFNIKDRRIDANLYFDFTSKTWNDYIPNTPTLEKEPDVPRPRVQTPSKSDRKRKFEQERKMAAADSLFSEPLLLIPACSSKRTKMAKVQRKD